MTKLNVSVSLFFSVLIVSCTGAPAPETVSNAETEPPAESSIQSCEELFGLWENFEADEEDIISSSLPAMMRHPPEEMVNLQTWEIEDLEIDLFLSTLQIPVVTGRVSVVEDRNDEDEIFEPKDSPEMAELFSASPSAESESEDVAVCIFRGLHPTEKCDYGFSLFQDPFIEIFSQQRVSYLFMVGLESNERAFLGQVKGEEIGCPGQIEGGEQIIGPEVETGQIVEVWNQSLGPVEVKDIGESESPFLQQQYLDILFLSESRQYLILVETEDRQGLINPVLVESTKDFGILKFGFTVEDQVTSLSIQEVEILDTRRWKKQETERAAFYTLEDIEGFDDQIGVDFNPMSEPVFLLQEGNLMREPKPGIAASVEKSFPPDLRINSSD